MLKELRISNFAIIDSLELEFDDGLVILTGETGAGKSILIDALLMVMGADADVTLIRTGSEKALIEATFTLSSERDPGLFGRLRAEGLIDEGDTLMVLSRELRGSNRSLARVNGSQVRLSLLRELGEFVVDIHGQAEHLSLLNVKKHIELLDRYANVEEDLKQYQRAYHALLATRKELQALREAQADSARRMDLLSFQAEEIENAALWVGEDDEIRQERDRLANAESISKLAARCLLLISEGDGRAETIMDQMGSVSTLLLDLVKMDSSQQELANQAELLMEQLAEIEGSLRLYAEGIEYNPVRLDQVEERLDLLSRLKRKYGGSLAAALAFAAACRAEMTSLGSAEERIEALSQQERQLMSQLSGHAQKLSTARSAAALALAKGIETELKDLNMDGARFEVAMRRQTDAQGLELEAGIRVAFHERGIDQVEFMIAPNQGEGFKPLVKIASGGETARLMLALKNVLVKADTVPTLIFDEIDQGIGGRMGLVVGEKLWRLAREHQVLCVTHLPQLAAFGDHHFKVEKYLTPDERTTTRVQRVKGETRGNELAEMLGGLRDANQKAAAELVALAGQRQLALTQQA